LLRPYLKSAFALTPICLLARSHVRDLHHGGDAGEAFRHHDKDDDGLLSVAELQRMLGHHKDVKGFFSKSIKATRLTKALDSNADGRVDKREWLASISDSNKKLKNEL
jgi:Ca2+-binding EF-hand superfamily protein